MVAAGEERAGEQRAEEAPPARATVAALTMVRNEAAMLPRWVRHYSAQCGGPEHLLVIDDNSEDGSTDDLPCPVIRIPPLKRGFERSRMALLSNLAAGLLEAYDAVLFADADEFLLADPDRYAALGDLVAAKPDVDVFGAVGLNLVHQVGVEGPLDPERPLLSQRRLAKFVPLMCKPALKRVAAPWTAASHGVTGVPYRIDPELFMFHAKFADRSFLRGAADHRLRMVEMDGRARRTNWKFGGEAMVDLLDRIVARLKDDAVKPFEADERLFTGIVRQEGEVFRARGPRQVQAMRRQPFVSVPARFAGLL